MLPTKGYFRDIDCPYHERKCGRPYCHFRHRKKTADVEDAAASTSTASITYKPTPKSELAGVAEGANKSHIPISYVPDMVRTHSSRKNYNVDRPTYKPTPKSVLIAGNKGAAGAQASATTYTPTPKNQLKDIPANDMDLERLDEEKFLNNMYPSEIHCIGHINEEELLPSTEKIEERIVAITTSDIHNSTEDGKAKDKEKPSHRDRHKSSKDSKSKQKSRHSHSSSSSSKTSKSPKDRKSSSSSSKSKSHSSDKSSTSSSNRSYDKDKKAHKTHSQKSSKSSKEEKTTSKEGRDKVDDDLHAAGFLDDDDYPDLDIEMDTMMIEDECLKIFNEYKAPDVKGLIEPPEPLKLMVPEEPPKEESSYGSGKKRIAYNNASNIARDDIKLRPAFKQLHSAGMTLQNRIRIARQAQASNEGQNILNEVKSMKRSALQSNVEFKQEVKKPKPNGVPMPKPKPPSTTVIDDILNLKSTTTAGTAVSSQSAFSLPFNTKPRRIAPVSNVMSIQMAKARIDEIKNRTIASNKTLATTVAKGSKRSAHIPDLSNLSTIPDVLQAERSKLPVNVRTRYLTLLAEESIKLYVSTEEAHNRALNEEFKCYERCKALPTYRNSAMLAVNRLRKEVQEREAAGLGPLQVGEVHGQNNESYLEGKRFYEQIKQFMLNEEELVLHGFPRVGPMHGKAVISSEHKQQYTSEHLDGNQRMCCRCHKVYPINREGFPLFDEECCYHPLRKRTIRGERTWLCCKSTDDTGCVISPTHVSEISADRELEGFQSTFDSEVEDDPRNYAVYALDCEMCYTTKGLELTRVTVINSELKTVYESLVKPFNPIIDYNTRFSGITAEHMEHTTTNILQIQATILHLCSSKTILIGHSLESDMKALKIIHSSIVDTSVMFPHKFGLPHKRALRVLASEYLKKIIQNDVGGHDSAEDALAAMELVLWKVKEDLKVKGIRT